MLRAITAQVLHPQEAPDAIPLTLKQGDTVRVGQPHPVRAGYVWAEDGQISAGWVPLDLLDLNSGRPRAKSAYCSAELTVAQGDTVRLIWEDTTRHTWWCEDSAGERGWMRLEDLKIDE
jgi:hypothetical protein